VLLKIATSMSSDYRKHLSRVETKIFIFAKMLSKIDETAKGMPF
jgi:hypothetical protein